MAEEEKQDQETQEPEAEQPDADAPGGDAAGADEAGEATGADEAGEATGADEAGEATPDAPPPLTAPAEEEGAEPLSPKEARKRARSLASGPPGSPRSASERAAERAERRRARAAGRRRRRASERSKRGERREGTPPAERRSGVRKVRQGKVISSKPDKTITVQIEVARRHPVYEKVVRRSATVHAHDERNEANEGDVVRVVESRPLSKTKRWRLAEILERAR